ncbi:MAG: hypothetical protein IJ424_02765 [Oscillospiraceae bacterium]|nr:hypothetical protein [Oscillospiraceae bacterium]
MKCPFCGKKTVEGYVQGARKIFFTEDIHNFFLAPDFDDLLLSKNNWTKPNCKAYHCPDCKKVIVDYSENEA